jgi:phosphoribosylaminoimidazole-succinocarboxamide synthase
MVIRGYLAGHAWRTYKSGARVLCGETLIDGLSESDRFPHPIITPATKAESGHDEDISAKEILDRGFLDESTWHQLCDYTQRLFERGSQMANDVGLILVDTKYEFGMFDGQIHLIDEIHTPDSSRYYYLDGYESRQRDGIHQEQLSKEFVREWLISEGFQGLENQNMPDMTDDFVNEISSRYVSLYERLTAREFIPADDVSDRELERLVRKALDL